jgi:predicted RNA-binding protein YlxR (DUF448 family)
VAPKAELVRLAVLHERGRPPRLVVDRAGAMPGRGAYLCRAPGAQEPARRCAERAARRGAIARTLRAPVHFDPADLVESGP